MAEATKLSRLDLGMVVASADPEVEQNWLPQHPEGQAIAAAVKATSPIRLDQLAAELADAVGRDVVALSAVGDLDGASTAAPVQVYTTDEGIAARALLDATKAHQPDPDWTLPVG